MIQVLLWVLDGIELIGSYVLWGLESAFNAIGAALVLAFNAAMSLLPSMAGAPSIGTPTWLSWLSWFYPVGDLLAGLTALVAMWVAFLAVRWVLRLVRAL